MFENLKQNLKIGMQPLNHSDASVYKSAFTLAEVLIVIGIIGVVAALTLPNLNHATGDKEKVTRVKKVYSTLTEAIDRAQAIYGSIDTWCNDLSTVQEMNERIAKRITEFMKISKDCGFEAGCFSTAPYVEADGTTVIEENFLTAMQSGNRYMVMLPDGISLAFDAGVRIKADIDGPNKGKNQYGNDIFDFTLWHLDSGHGDPINQLQPSSARNKWTGDLTEGSTKGQYATAWVIENGNLDYLKCYDELNWETKTSCE